MTTARQRALGCVCDLALDQLGVAVERRGDRVDVAEDQRDVKSGGSELRVVLQQRFDAIEAAAQGGVDESTLALTAIAADRIGVRDERRPGREAELLRDCVLGVSEARGAIGSQSRERLGISGAGGA